VRSISGKKKKKARERGGGEGSGGGKEGKREEKEIKNGGGANLSTFVSVTMYPQYNNNIHLKKKRKDNY
jgi:hypothetical protein